MDDLLKYKEVAKELDIHLNTLKKIIKRGEIEIYKFGPRTHRISREELERYKTNRIKIKD